MRLVMLLASGFGSGYLPVAPGTWGSLVALPLHYFLSRLSVPVYAASLVGIIALSVLVAGSAEKVLDTKDPGVVVIDEIAGMLVTMIAAPNVWWVYGAGFLLFRLFDIVKPFPANWCDSHLQGGIGIVADDLVAGVYALICLQVVVRLFA